MRKKTIGKEIKTTKKRIRRKSEDLYSELWVFPTLDNVGVVIRWLIGTISLIIFGTLSNASSDPIDIFNTFSYLFKSWTPLSLSLLVIFGFGYKWLRTVHIYWCFTAWVVCTITISFITTALIYDGHVFVTWTFLFKNLFRDVLFMFLLLYFFDGEHRRGSISWARTKIDSLQARMHPHFLFNTLNNFAEMVYDDKPEELEEAILDLADLTRAMIGHKPVVSAETEKKTAIAYIKLQMIRFEDRLSVNWDWTIDDDLEMPSLLLQPLIENAIKYGIEPINKDNTIQINGWTEDENIYVQIINPYYAKNDEKKGNGITLINLTERLKWLYGGKQYCYITRTEQEFIVEVKIPKKKFNPKKYLN